MGSLLEISLGLVKDGEGFNPRMHSVDGVPHIGHGLNLAVLELTEAESEYLVKNRLLSFITGLNQFPWFRDLSLNRRAVLVDMAYNMGFAGCCKFKNMVAAIGAGDFKAAAYHMGDSDYCKQVGDRCKRNQKIMAEDVYIKKGDL